MNKILALSALGLAVPVFSPPAPDAAYAMIEGQITSEFGERGDGTDNDGIDIAVPLECG